MSVSLALVCLWVLAGVVTGMAAPRWPRHLHRAGAIGLVLTGIPLLGLVTWQYGPFIGLIAMVAGMSVVRWPVVLVGLSVEKRLRALVTRYSVSVFR